MSHAEWPEHAAPSVVQRIDQVCNHFEDAWKAGRRPQIEEYLKAAPRAERAALLAELVSLDIEYRQQQGEQLRIEEYRDRFPELPESFPVETPLYGMADAESATTPSCSVSADALGNEANGPQVPGYEILSVLGRGGMGVVYRARQVALNRVVALKMILAGEHAGPDELRRFRGEAEAVARLQHAHIVHIHEVGEHCGRAYFALEYVDGGNLGQKIAGMPQAPREAAGLMETLARAVQHAHERGILHRDLKPANVLLGKDGVVKITDFGLAKRLDAEPGVGGPTRSGAVLGTPSYMAPEQAGSQKQTLTPATDVYALGAILYELLTGRPPHSGATALDTLEQVRTQEPVSPGRLQPKVPRDLETLCLKCLEKEPSKRYASAEALAEDLRRFLDARPILARPIGPAGRFWRWCRRKPGVAIASGLAAALLLIGTGGLTTTIVAISQREQAALLAREQAENQRNRADANLRLARAAVDKTVTKITGDHRLKEADFHQLRQDLLEYMVPLYEEFVKQRESDPELEAERALAYERLAFLRMEMKESARAMSDYEHMRAIFAQLVAEFPTVPEYRRGLATSQHQLGNLLRDLGKRREAESAFRDSLRIYEQLATEFREVPQYRNAVAGSYNSLGILLTDLGKFGEGEAAHRTVLRIREQVIAEFPKVAKYRQDLAISHENLGSTLGIQGKFGEAEAAYRESLRIREQLASDFPKDVRYRHEIGRSHSNLGISLRELQKPAAAEASCREAIRIQEQLAAGFPSVPDYRHELARSHYSLGLLLEELYKHGPAEGAYREAIRIQEQLDTDFPNIPSYRHGLALSHGSLGILLKDLGNYGAAEAAYGEAIGIEQQLAADFPEVPQYRQNLARCQANLGILLSALGKRAEAEAAYRRAVSIHQQLAADSPEVPEYRYGLALSHNSFGVLLQQLGNYGAAEAAFRDALRIREQLVTELPTVPDYQNDLAGTLVNLSLVAVDQLKFEQARLHLERALPHHQAALKANPQHQTYRQFFRNNRITLARTLAGLGEHASATAIAEEMAHIGWTPSTDCYAAAYVLSRCIPMVEKDTKLAAAERAKQVRAYADRALDLLREALAKGYKDADHMKKDKALDPLRSRPDFQELLGKLEEKK